ncbi:hypothetical protein Y032_0636g927 [Ancylostoma ceylanicum]|uniref:Uncharacterized protein n=1 Tax=Ancylostoma ceylanicum TaxID=53326 RepID=A0A016WKV6_9BILA|nr:hypothetical protein Y032_0636g927 [Ancylostoma ceylanicum]
MCIRPSRKSCQELTERQEAIGRETKRATASQQKIMPAADRATGSDGARDQATLCDSGSTNESEISTCSGVFATKHIRVAEED